MDIIPQVTNEVENELLRTMAALIFRGKPIHDAAQLVSEQRNHVGKAQLVEAWRQREKWLYNVFNVDSDVVVQQVMSEQVLIKQQLYELVDETDQIKQKRLLLKDIKTMNNEMIELMLDIGVIERQASKLELTGKDGSPLEISSIAKLADEWSDED